VKFKTKSTRTNILYYFRHEYDNVDFILKFKEHHLKYKVPTQKLRSCMINSRRPLSE